MACFEKGRWIIEVWEEWSQFVQRCNWYTFRLLMIEFEDERNMGDAEVTIVVLGFGFRVSFQHTDTEFLQDLNDRLAAVQADLAAPPSDTGER